MKIRIAIIAACAATFALVQTDRAQAAKTYNASHSNTAGKTYNSSHSNTANVTAPKGGKTKKPPKANNTTTRSNTQHN